MILRVLQLLNLLQRRGASTGGEDPALANGIVLLDSNGKYLMDSTGAVLYPADELFTTADGFAFRTADGALYGVSA